MTELARDLELRAHRAGLRPPLPSQVPSGRPRRLLAAHAGVEVILLELVARIRLLRLSVRRPA